MRFRPRGLEALEDRAVPSVAGASVHAEASNSSSSSAATVQQKLAQVDAQITTAYSNFATTVFAAETAFISSGGLSTLSTSVNQAINTLATTLTTAVSGSIASTTLGLVQAQVNSATPGSLLSTMQRLISVGTINSNPFGPSLDPLFTTAVANSISASYTSALVDAYLVATGHGASATSTHLNLGQYAASANATYTSFASSVYGAELTLTTPDGSPAPATTVSNAQAIVDAQVGGLVQGLGSLVANTPVASRASVIQGQFIGGPGSLQFQLDALFTVAVGTGGPINPGGPSNPVPTAGGTIDQSLLPLLYTAVDAAISASYLSNAVEAYILATA
jgi:hypothetical protein